MKHVIFLAAALVAIPSLAAGHLIRGHVTKNGTYVAPARATNPDSSRFNNYTSKPNVNPYTGKAGTVDPTTPKLRRR